MNVLIVGGGISGISAAKIALREGHTVTIVECAPEPGGLMARIANCRVGFKSFFDEIKEKSRLTVIKDATITGVTRQDKGFTVALADGQKISADKVVIAAGLSPYDPVEFRGKRVLTSLEYDALIDQRNVALPPAMSKIAFVLCVGSRSQEYPLCSSVCCTYTLREIKWTLQRGKPDITVFYNDLRFFGQEFFMEKVYRDAGVRFVRANSRYFDEDEDGVTLRYFSDGALHEERFDYVVLAIGLRPNPLLADLGRLFGFSLNELGFVKEDEPLKTDAEGVYVCGGALEPMNIKDSICTGFGAGLLAIRGSAFPEEVLKQQEKLYKEASPDLPFPDGAFSSCLFYIGTEDAGYRMFYEYLSSAFIQQAREWKKAGKTVYVISKNLVMPSYEELRYEQARREGVIFLHIEEGEQVAFEQGRVRIHGLKREVVLPVEKAITFDEYAPLFNGRDFLSMYRSEPQLRWSPTKWGRKKYHVGFIRHPRAERWEPREILGALGEMVLDVEEDRVLPEVNEERCSGCGSCKEACPHSAIEMAIKERAIGVFGRETAALTPVAHVKQDTCVGCGLCASTCPSDVIVYNP